MKLLLRRRSVTLVLLLNVSACASSPTSVRVERITDGATASYLTRIQTAVQQRWSPPCLPPTMPTDADGANTPRTVPSGAVTVDLFVAKNGDLTDVRIMRSSGHDAIDTAAVTTVRAVAPFPPVPDELSGAGITVRTTLAFGDGANTACQSQSRGDHTETARLSPAQHAQAQGLVGRWGNQCDLEILEVDTAGSVRTRAVDGTEIVGRYEPRDRHGVAGTVSWPWPAALVRWERRLNDLGVAGSRITYFYRPNTPVLYVENSPYTKVTGSSDNSGDRLYRCER